MERAAAFTAAPKEALRMSTHELRFRRAAVFLALMATPAMGCNELLHLPAEHEHPEAWVRLGLESYEPETESGALIAQAAGGTCLWLHLSDGTLTHRGSEAAPTLSLATTAGQQHVVEFVLEAERGVLSVLLHAGDCDGTNEPDEVLGDAWCRLPSPCPPRAEETSGGEGEGEGEAAGDGSSSGGVGSSTTSAVMETETETDTDTSGSGSTTTGGMR
jgi:hypothetical protein